MLRWLLVSASVLSVSLALVFAFPTGPAGRTLHPNELWGLYGGANNYCCGANSNCTAVGSACSDADSEMACMNQIANIVFAGNKETCTLPVPGKHCTEGMSYVCWERYLCEWETTPIQQCVTGLRIQQFTNPSSCNDNCN